MEIKFKTSLGVLDDNTHLFAVHFITKVIHWIELLLKIHCYRKCTYYYVVTLCCLVFNVICIMLCKFVNATTYILHISDCTHTCSFYHYSL